MRPSSVSNQRGSCGQVPSKVQSPVMDGRAYYPMGIWRRDDGYIPRMETVGSRPEAAGLAHVATVSFLASRASPAFGFWIALAGGVALARVGQRDGARL